MQPYQNDEPSSRPRPALSVFPCRTTSTKSASLPIAIKTSSRVVLDNELDLLDDCVEVVGTVPVGADSLQYFHVELPNGGGSATLQNVLELRAAGLVLEVTAPKATDLQPGTTPNTDSQFPSVPEFTFFVYDHLGNTRVMYHNDMYDCQAFHTHYVLEHVLDYYPYGKTLREYLLDRERFETTYHERDVESGLDYRGARFYDGDVGRFLSTDPKAADFAGWSTYNYVLGNPVRLADKDGNEPEDVIITFNKAIGKLTLIDLDHYDPTLPTAEVSSYEYQMGGIRDDKGNLVMNQILVIDNVFSGGHVDGSNFVSNGNANEEEIPNGNFDILDNKSATNHPDWLRLDPQDGKNFNDQYDGNSGLNSAGNNRNGFRLHTGRVSWGCVTLCKTISNDRAMDWVVLNNILQSTSSSLVPDKRGNQSWNPFSYRIKYGEMKVVGNIPDDTNIQMD